MLIAKVAFDVQKIMQDLEGETERDRERQRERRDKESSLS
jgi:hypothetical protein